MITRLNSAKVISNAVSADKVRYGDLPVVEFGAASFYNPVVQEGGAFGDTTGYAAIYLIDTDGAQTITLKLDKPAGGGETVTVTETIDSQGYASTPSMASIATLPGTFTYTFKKGEQQHDFTVTPKAVTCGFQPRRVIYTITGVTGLTKAAVYDKFIAVFHTLKQFPVASLVGVGAIVAPSNTLAVGQTTQFLIKLQDQAESAAVTTVDETTLYIRAYKVSDNSDFSQTLWAKDNVKVVVPAGTTTAGGGTVFTGDGVVQSGSGSTNIYIKIVTESKTVAFTQDSVDPNTKNYGRTFDVGRDQNLWHWTNDIVRLGYENDNKAVIDGGGIRYGMPAGYPTPGLPDGAEEITAAQPRVDTVDQSAADVDKVKDPITDNYLQYAVPNNNVISGNPYLRESFNQVYCGGTLTGYPLQRWVYAAMRMEPFKTADGGQIDTIRNVANDDTSFIRTKQSPYFRVGYRCRTANRNHGVAFEWRNAGPATGYSKFGDQTPASTTLTFDASDFADCFNNAISFIDNEGVRKIFAIPTTAGGSYTGSQSNVIVWAGAVPTTAAETATAFASLVNAQSGYSMTAAVVGNGLVLTHKDAAPLNKCLTYVPYQLDSGAAWQSALGHSPATPSGQYFTVSSIINQGRQSMAPTVASGTGELPGSPLVLNNDGQYYYDSVTGVEVWFLKRYNMWNPDYAADGTITRPAGVTSGDMLYSGSHNAWGTWYGVVRDESGLVCYMHNYIAATKPTQGVAYSDSYTYAWDLTSTDPKNALAANTVIDYNTWPPTSANREAANTGAAMESAGSGPFYVDDIRGWEASVPNAEAMKGNSIQYPSWHNASDRSNGESGFRPYGINFVRTNKVGAMWHSQQFKMSQQNSTGQYDDPPYGSGLQPFWPNNSVTRYPRGGNVGGTGAQGSNTTTPT